MKKPIPKAGSKVLILALAAFGFFFVKSLINLLSPYRAVAQNEQIQAGPAAGQKDLLPPVDAVPLNQIRTRNIFMSAFAKSKPAPGSAAETPALPPLGKNEIRDPETGATFRYLGILALPDQPLAFFARLGEVPKGEPKYLFLPKGKSLSKNIRLEDIAENRVRLNQAGQKIDLNVFFLEIKEIKPADSRKKDNADKGKKRERP